MHRLCNGLICDRCCCAGYCRTCRLTTNMPQHGTCPRLWLVPQSHITVPCLSAATASADASTQPIAEGVDPGALHAYARHSTPLVFRQVEMNDCFISLRMALQAFILSGLGFLLTGRGSTRNFARKRKQPVIASPLYNTVLKWPHWFKASHFFCAWIPVETRRRKCYIHGLRVYQCMMEASPGRVVA